MSKLSHIPGGRGIWGVNEISSSLSAILSIGRNLSTRNIPSKTSYVTAKRKNASTDYFGIHTDTKQQVPIDGEECSPNTSPFGSVVLPGQELKPEFMLPDETGESFRPDRKNVFTCTNCVQCGGDRENMGPCCGCVNMDLSKGYSDIPSCPSCNPDDGSWPGDLSDVDTLNVDDDESLDQRSGLGLEKRVSGEATMSDKKVTICPAAGETTQYWLTGDLAYPAFPAPHDNPWDDIEQGRWKDISTYWGNTSDTCSDWSTASRTDHDTALIGDASGIKKVRAKYQSESRLLLSQHSGNKYR